MEPHTHYFFAVKIPEKTKEILKEHIERLKDIFPFRRWVHPQDLHITLAFLGSASPDMLAAATANAAKTLAGNGTFSINIIELGVFGKMDSPRVFWAGMEKREELHLIRNKVYHACEQAGFKLETRPFSPHITIARKWSGQKAFEKQKLQVWKELQPEGLPFQAQEVVLYQTHLDRTPKYQAVKIFPLET